MYQNECVDIRKQISDVHLKRWSDSVGGCHIVRISVGLFIPLKVGVFFLEGGQCKEVVELVVGRSQSTVADTMKFKETYTGRCTPEQ